MSQYVFLLTLYSNLFVNSPMRIALIQTPIEDFYSTQQRTYPLGLTYLAASIKDLPVNVKILDLLTGHGRQSIPIPKSFKAIMPLLPYDRSPISAFHTYYHWGMSWKNIKRYFTENIFDLYAISSNFYTYSQEILKTAEIIKKINPQAIILVGGQNVGPEHELFTSSKYIDLCIKGEGELSFRKLLTQLLNKQNISSIPGLWCNKTKTWNAISVKSDFNHYPDSELLPTDKYKIAGKKAMMIATSRGCPMGCSFCSVAHTFGSRMRMRPINQIVQEMRHAYDRGIRAFDIEDDNFTFVKDHCIKLLKAISDEFSGNISLYAMNGLSAEHLDNEVISLLKKCGMNLLNLSIATSSKEQLKRIHRKTSIAHFIEISNMAASHGLKVMGHFISGMPGQTAKEIIDTMCLLSELPLILGISPFYYIPGMQMQVPNIPPSCKEARLSRFWPADMLLSEIDLITLFRLSRWINYVKKQLSDQHINSLEFSMLSSQFPNDPYIISLIDQLNIIGQDANKEHFTHQTSPKIINLFLKRFKGSLIRI